VKKFCIYSFFGAILVLCGFILGVSFSQHKQYKNDWGVISFRYDGECGKYVKREENGEGKYLFTCLDERYTRFFNFFSSSADCLYGSASKNSKDQNCWKFPKKYNPLYVRRDTRDTNYSSMILARYAVPKSDTIYLYKSGASSLVFAPFNDSNGVAKQIKP
jgi:hypothetical protein